MAAEAISPSPWKEAANYLAVVEDLMLVTDIEGNICVMRLWIV